MNVLKTSKTYATIASEEVAEGYADTWVGNLHCSAGFGEEQVWIAVKTTTEKPAEPSFLTSLYKGVKAPYSFLFGNKKTGGGRKRMRKSTRKLKKQHRNTKKTKTKTK